jgi:lysophospholipase L1-like esterase
MGTAVRTVLCFGDSNTNGADPVSGGRFPWPVRWPGVLQDQLGTSWRVIEEGLGGRTTRFDDPFVEGKNGLTYLVPCLDTHAPIDLVAIMLGTNDLKTMYRTTPQMIANGMASLVRTTRRSESGPGGAAPKILVIAPAPLGPVSELAGLWGFGDAPAASREVARLYQLVAEREGAQFLDGGSVASVDPSEGVHLTAESHAALARAVASRIAEWFPLEELAPDTH